MANPNVRTLKSINSYLALYNFISAMKVVEGNLRSYFTVGNVTKDELANTIINHYAELGYSYQPTKEELAQCMANAEFLTGSNNVLNASAMLSINNHAKFAESYNEFVNRENQDRVNKQKVYNEEQKSYNEIYSTNKQTVRKKRNSQFGKAAVVGSALGLSFGYLYSLYTLVGGWVGLASVGSMPILFLGIVGGVVLYNVGKAITKRLLKGLNKSIDKANELLKGDENVMGSNKSLQQSREKVATLRKSVQAVDKNLQVADYLMDTYNKIDSQMHQAPQNNVAFTVPSEVKENIVPVQQVNKGKVEENTSLDSDEQVYEGEVEEQKMLAITGDNNEEIIDVDDYTVEQEVVEEKSVEEPVVESPTVTPVPLEEIEEIIEESKQDEEIIVESKQGKNSGRNSNPQSTTEKPAERQME